MVFKLFIQKLRKQSFLGLNPSKGEVSFRLVCAFGTGLKGHCHCLSTWEKIALRTSKERGD